MTLITRNLEQIRRVASQHTKDLKKQNTQPDYSNITDTMKIDIASMRKSKFHKETKNYLSQEVAEEELMMTLNHYSLHNYRDRVMSFIAKITQQQPSAFTMRVCAEFLSDILNEYKIKKNIK